MNSPLRSVSHVILFSPLLAISLLASRSTLADETVNAVPARHLTGTIGFDYTKDTSVPGQEISQQDIPIGLIFETENCVFEVNIPYIQRTAPSGKVAKSHHHESRKDAATVSPLVTNAGLGDVTTSLRYTLLNEKDAPLSLFVKGEVKLATAEIAKGLGTGVNDYFGELRASKTLGDFTGSASIGYAIMGSPGEVKINDVKKFLYFNNIYFGSVGGSYQFTESLHADLNLDMGQATETGGSQQRDLSAAMEFKFSPTQSIRMQVLKSIAPGISSWGASAYLSTAL